jgi:hypothetical protein
MHNRSLVRDKSLCCQPKRGRQRQWLAFPKIPRRLALSICRSIHSHNCIPGVPDVAAHPEATQIQMGALQAQESVYGHQIRPVPLAKQYQRPKS